MKVLPRHAAEHPDLILVDRRLCGGKAPAGAGFHFDKAESGIFPGHQVKIATNLRTAPTARYNDVAAAAQIEKGCLFSRRPTSRCAGRVEPLLKRTARASLA